MTFTRTHTRTHTYTAFANPYLRCTTCGNWIEGWHDPAKCGCDTLLVNVPCCCGLEYDNLCPSWSPVDGCTCEPGSHDTPALMPLPGERPGSGPTEPPWKF